MKSLPCLVCSLFMLIPSVIMAEAETVVIEPESGLIRSSLGCFTGYDTGALNDGYIMLQRGQLEIQFTIPATGDYYVYIRTNDDHNKFCSLFMSVDDDAPESMIQSFYYEHDTWVTKQLYDGDNFSEDNPLCFENLTQGQHTLYITGYKSDNMIDSIIFSTDESFESLEDNNNRYCCIESEAYTQLSFGVSLIEEYQYPVTVSRNRAIELDGTDNQEGGVSYNVSNIVTEYSTDYYLTIRAKADYASQQFQVNLGNDSKTITTSAASEVGSWCNYSIALETPGEAPLPSSLSVDVTDDDIVIIDKIWISTDEGTLPMDLDDGIVLNGNFDQDYDDNDLPDYWTRNVANPSCDVYLEHIDSYIDVDDRDGSGGRPFLSQALVMEPTTTNESHGEISISVGGIEEEEYYVLGADLFAKDVSWYEDEEQDNDPPLTRDSMARCLDEAIGISVEFFDSAEQSLGEEVYHGSQLAKYMTPSVLIGGTTDIYYWPRQLIEAFKTPEDTTSLTITLFYDRDDSDLPNDPIYWDNIRLTQETDNLDKAVDVAAEYYDDLFGSSGEIISHFTSTPAITDDLFTYLTDDTNEGLVNLCAGLEMPQVSPLPPGCLFAAGDFCHLNRFRKFQTLNEKDSVSVFGYLESDNDYYLHITTDGSPGWYGGGISEIELDGCNIGERGIWVWRCPHFNKQDNTPVNVVVQLSDDTVPVEDENDPIRLGVFFFDEAGDIEALSGKEGTRFNSSQVTFIEVDNAEDDDSCDYDSQEHTLTFYGQTVSSISEKNYFGFGYYTTEGTGEGCDYELDVSSITFVTDEATPRELVVFDNQDTPVGWTGPDRTGGYFWDESFTESDYLQKHRLYQQGLLFGLVAALRAELPGDPFTEFPFDGDSGVPDAAEVMLNGLDCWSRDMLPNGIWSTPASSQDWFMMVAMPELFSLATGYLHRDGLTEAEKLRILKWFWALREAGYGNYHTFIGYNQFGYNFNLKCAQIGMYAGVGCLCQDEELVDYATDMATRSRRHCIPEPQSWPTSTLSTTDPIFGLAHYTQYRNLEEDTFNFPPALHYQDLAANALAYAYSYADRLNDSSLQLPSGLSDALVDMKTELDKHFRGMAFIPFAASPNGGYDFGAAALQKHYWEGQQANGIISAPVFLAWWLQENNGDENLRKELLRVAEARAKAETKFYDGYRWGWDVYGSLLWYNAYPQGGLSTPAPAVESFVRRNTGFGWDKLETDKELALLSSGDLDKLDRLGFSARWNFELNEAPVYYQFDFIAMDGCWIETPVGGYIIPPPTDDDVWPDMAFNPYSVGLGGAIFEVLQGTGDYATYYTCSGKSGDNDDMTFRRCYAKDNACGVLYRGRLSRPEYRGYPNCGTYYDDELPLWLTQAWWTFGGYLFGFVDPEASSISAPELGVNEVNYFLDFPPWENMLEVTDVSVSGWPRSNWLTPVQDANFDFFEVDSVLEGPQHDYNLEDSDIVGWRVAVRFDQSQSGMWVFKSLAEKRFGRYLHRTGVSWDGETQNPLSDPPEVMYILAPADHTELNGYSDIYVSVKETNPKYVVYKSDSDNVVEVGVANFSNSAVTLSLDVPVSTGNGSTYSVRLYSDDPNCSDPVNGEAGTNLTVTNGRLNVGSAVAEILATLSPGKLASHHTYYIKLVKQ